MLRRAVAAAAARGPARAVLVAGGTAGPPGPPPCAAGRRPRGLPRPLRRAPGPAALPADPDRARPPRLRGRDRGGPRPGCGPLPDRPAEAPAARGRRRRGAGAAPTSSSSTPREHLRPCRTVRSARSSCRSGAPRAWFEAGGRRAGRVREPAAGGLRRPLHPTAGDAGDRRRARRAGRRADRGHDDRHRSGRTRSAARARRREPARHLARLGAGRASCRPSSPRTTSTSASSGPRAKALDVVPTKVYQGAAAGCVVVTSDTHPQRAALGEAAVLVPPGDAGGARRRPAGARRRPRPGGPARCCRAGPRRGRVRARGRRPGHAQPYREAPRGTGSAPSETVDRARFLGLGRLGGYTMGTGGTDPAPVAAASRPPSRARTLRTVRWALLALAAAVAVAELVIAYRTDGTNDVGYTRSSRPARTGTDRSTLRRPVRRDLQPPAADRLVAAPGSTSSPRTCPG